MAITMQLTYNEIARRYPTLLFACNIFFIGTSSTPTIFAFLDSLFVSLKMDSHREHFRLRETGENQTARNSSYRTDADAFRTDQFTVLNRRPQVPVKSIVLAISLFIIGTILLIVGSLLVTGVVIPHKYSDRTIPVVILGAITFLPGAYHTYLAWGAYKKYKGFSYDAIPSFDDWCYCCHSRSCFFLIPNCTSSIFFNISVLSYSQCCCCCSINIVQLDLISYTVEMKDGINLSPAIKGSFQKFFFVWKYLWLWFSVDVFPIRSASLVWLTTAYGLIFCPWLPQFT